MLEGDEKRMNDEIIRDLIILSCIPRGGRIRRGTDGTIDVEKRENFMGFFRYLCGDSRTVSIQKIEQVINRAFSKVDDLLLKKSLDIYLLDKAPLPSEIQDHNEVVDCLFHLAQNMDEALKGIDNLKETYHDDVNTSAQLQIIADKIRRKVSRIRIKLDEAHNRHVKKHN